MEANEVRQSLVAWIDRVGGVGLVLPGGWFGRPYDNRHELTWAFDRGSRLLVELDEHLLFVLTEPEIVREDEREFVIRSRQAVFDWREYGSDIIHADFFGDGSEIRLVAK